MKNIMFIALITLGMFTNSSQAQTLQESANFANLYCMKYFSGCFPGREYQQVVVNQSFPVSANSVGMTGTVTFLDAFGLPKENYFELLMTITPYNMVEVQFSKLNTVFGTQYWEYCNNSFSLQTASQTTTTYSSGTSDAVNNLRKQQDIQRIVNQYNKVSWETSKTVVNNFR